MSSTNKHAVLTALRSLMVLLALGFLFSSVARAQTGNSGGASLGGTALGGAAGGLDGSNGAPNAQNDGTDSDSSQGAVSNAMHRGCVEPSDPNAANSGLPPCANSLDDNGDSDEPAQAGPSTLSGGSSLSGGSLRRSGDGGAGLRQHDQQAIDGGGDPAAWNFARRARQPEK